MDVEFAWLGGAAPVGFRMEYRISLLVFCGGIGRAQLIAERRRTGAIDGLSVDLQPAPNLAQIILAGLWDDALGSGSDIQQVVATLADDVHQFESNVFGSLPISVVFLEAPGVIHGSGNFPVALHNAVGNSVIAHRTIVAFGPEAAVDQGGGLQGVHDVDESLAALAAHHARRIEPDEADRAIACKQLFDLRLGLAAQILVEVLLVVGTEIPGIARAIGFMPVLS